MHLCRTAHNFCGFFFDRQGRRQQVGVEYSCDSDQYYRIRYVLPTGFATFVPFFFPHSTILWTAIIYAVYRSTYAYAGLGQLTLPPYTLYTMRNVRLVRFDVWRFCCTVKVFHWTEFRIFILITRNALKSLRNWAVLSFVTNMVTLMCNGFRFNAEKLDCRVGTHCIIKMRVKIMVLVLFNYFIVIYWL